jgi:hypothetical protein
MKGGLQQRIRGAGTLILDARVISVFGWFCLVRICDREYIHKSCNQYGR